MYQQGKWTYVPTVRKSGDSWIWGVDKIATGAQAGPGNTVREGTAKTEEEANKAAQKALREILAKDPGKVISDGDNVRLGNKTGKVINVMSDTRSRVKWDDGTSTVEDSSKLIVMPRK